MLAVLFFNHKIQNSKVFSFCFTIFLKNLNKTTWIGIHATKPSL